MNNDNNLNGEVLGSVNNNPAPAPTATPEVASNPNVVSELSGSSQVMAGGVVPPSAPVETPVAPASSAPVPPVENPAPAPQVETPAAPQAYTNPQTISPSQIPGFEDHNQIGQTPPISSEQDQKPKKKKNKFLFILLILVVLGGIGYGTYYLLNNTDLLKKKEKISIVTKNKQLGISETLPDSITEYATITGTDPSNCYLDTKDVDMTKEGSYKFTVTCGEGNKKTGTITVMDDSELLLETKTVYKTTGEKVSASEFSINKDYTYAFVDEEEVNVVMANTSGTHSVKLTVSKGSKSQEVEGKIVILPSKIKGYVNCSSNGQLADETSNAPKLVVAKKFAILNDSLNSFAGFAYDVNTFTFDDESLYNNYLSSHNKGEKITINDVSGWSEFTTDSEGKPTIIITKELSKEDLSGEYGEENLANFGSIIQYFSKQGLNCVFSKAE